MRSSGRTSGARSRASLAFFALADDSNRLDEGSTNRSTTRVCGCPVRTGCSDAGTATLRAVKRAFVVRSVVWGLLMVAGCTRLSDTQRFEPNPNTVEITATMPEPDGEALPDVSVRLCWSDLLDPSSVTDVDAVMGSGSLLTDTALGFELRPWTSSTGETLGQDATDPWCSGSVLTVTPKERLVPGVQYRMRLADVAVGWEGEHPNLDAPGWVHSDDGTDANFFLEFDVVEDPKSGLDPEDEPEPEAVTLRALFEDGAVFDPNRATCSCHRDPDDDASVLLDLRTPEAAYEDLLFDARLRDTGYPMVTPRRPSESFLIHKVLRKDGGPLPGVYGDAMPLGEDTLPFGDYVMLARWIEDGAAP